MPFANLRPFDFGPAHRRGMLLGALAFAIAASLGLAASWFLSLQVPLYAAAGSRSADFGHLLLGVSTLAWTMAATVAWIIIRGQRQQIALLAESRERNRAIVDNMVDGAIHIDGDGRLVALNSAAERIFHWYSAELRDKPLTTLLATCSHGQMEGVLHDQITESPNQDPSSRTHEVIGRRRDGTEFPLYLAISEVQTGGYPVLTAIARDLTDTHRQMAELAEARDQAMAADRAKSQFLAVMSHEIRTPMNGILGMLELLRDGSLSQQQQDFLDTAEKSSTMLLSIINDILDLSKIEAGKLDLQEIEFDLRASVEEVTALVASNARDKLIEVASFVERDVPNQVRGDPYRIRQVLLNLMGNAVKFTQDGEVVAHVSVKQDGEHGLVVRVQVRDTGIGIEPEVAEKLFQPFTQADASTTRRFGGTGLGLVISKRLVNLMGGEIGVDSTANEGSTFWFTVRLARSESPPQRTERDLRTARVLIVDDNATNRLILESYLRNWGAETESVDSGRSGDLCTAAGDRRRSTLRAGHPRYADARDGRHRAGATHQGRQQPARDPIADVELTGLSRRRCTPRRHWREPIETGSPESAARCRAEGTGHAAASSRHSRPTQESSPAALPRQGSRRGGQCGQPEGCVHDAGPIRHPHGYRHQRKTRR